MQCFSIKGEHVRDFKELVNTIKNNKIVVLYAGRDKVFDTMYEIVIQGSIKKANMVRDLMWEHNDGAFAQVETVTL